MRAKIAEREQALEWMRDYPLASDRAIARELGVGNKTVSRWRAAGGGPRFNPIPSLTTQDVLDALHERGRAISPRRLRRWVELGLLGNTTRARLHFGPGSTVVWAPEVVEQALEVDLLMRRHRRTYDVTLGLIGHGHERGYDIGEETVQSAYRCYLEAVYRTDLFIPRVAGMDIAPDVLAKQLRRRSLSGVRWALKGQVINRGIAALSAEVRMRRDDMPDRPRSSDVLYTQVDGTGGILRETISSALGFDDFLNALENPPAPELVAECHRRLTLESVSAAVAASTVDELKEACAVIKFALGLTADMVLELRPDYWGDPEQTGKWHELYREVLEGDSLTPARIAPFFIALYPFPELEPVWLTWLGEGALLYPDWRAMLFVLFTWPQLILGDWRAVTPPVELISETG